MESKEGLRECQNIYTQREGQRRGKGKVYTSFGSLKDSKQRSAPKYSFGRSNRQQQPKLFVTKGIARTDNFGKFTPNGANYTVTDKFTYSKSPEWKMQTTPRLKLSTEYQYEYYHRVNNLDISKANKKVQNRSANADFGRSPRFQKVQETSPGPEYFPAMKPEVKKQPAYSITMKRNVKGQDPILVVNGTDEAVGPGAYDIENNIYTTKEKPKGTFPRSQRSPYASSTSLHQTYDITSSMGAQLKSSKSSRPKYTINGSRRANSPGILKTEMQFQPMKVRIAHPSF